MEAKPAPTTIPHPAKMGAKSGKLQYLSLPFLIELKVAAGRVRDEDNVVELIRANPQDSGPIRQHFQTVHSDYFCAFEQLEARAKEQRDE